MPSKLQVVQKIGNTTLYIRMCDKATFYIGFCHPENKDVRWALKTYDRTCALSLVLKIDALLCSNPIPCLKEIKTLLENRRATPSSSDIRLGAYLHRFSKSYPNWNSVATWKAGMSHLSELVVHFGTDKLLSEITSTDMGDLLAAINQRSSAATYNRYRAVYSVFFKFAVDPLKLIKDDPVESFKGVKVQQKRVMPLRDNECAALINELHPYAKLVVVLLLNTGLRIGELRKLRWEHVDFDAKRISLGETKGKKTRYIPMNPSAFDSLHRMQSFPIEKLPRLSMARHKPDQFDSGLVLMVKDMKKALCGAAVRAGISHVHAHRFRHTLATKYWRNNGHLSKLMALLGHSTPRMALLYAKQTELKDGELDGIDYDGG